MNLDPVLLDLYRVEVETHMRVLSDGLLQLERDQSRSEWFDPLMRAAHSLKGAAKIVGASAAVQMAHAIEDYFLAAKSGRVAITSDATDVLLAGIDVLQAATQLDDEGAAPENWRAVSAQIAELAVGRPLAPETQVSRPAPIVPATSITLSAPRVADAAWAESQWNRLLKADQETCTEICVDLGECQSIEPAGLALLARAATLASRSGSETRLRLMHVPPPLEQLLAATGLDRPWASAGRR